MTLSDEEKAYVERIVINEFKKYLESEGRTLEEELTTNTDIEAIGIDSIDYEVVCMDIEGRLGLRDDYGLTKDVDFSMDLLSGNYPNLKISDLIKAAKKAYEEERAEA